MSNKEYVAIIIVIVTMVCLLIIPRLYYHTNNPADITDIITAIYITSAVKTVLLGVLIIWITYSIH